MITKSDIVELAQGLFRRDVSVRESKLFHPIRDWYVGLALSGLIAVSGALYGAHLFVTYSADAPLLPTRTLTEISYEKGLIEYILLQYEERLERFEEITANAPESTVATSTESRLVDTPPRLEDMKLRTE